MGRNRETNNEAGTSGRVIDRLWRFFSSVRLALVLMLVLTGLSLIGALLIQAPGDVLVDKEAYAFWLESAAEPKYGAWTPLFSLFRLFDMFHSPWFLGAGALLIISILVCSLNRWQSLRLTLSGGPVKLGETFYTGGNTHGELITGASSSPEAVNRVLVKRGYRVRTEQHDDKVYIAADKNRSFRLGTYVSHLSIVLFIIGFLIGSYFGFRDTDFIVTEGVTQDVGHNTDLSLSLESFVDEYYDDGMPRDYRSQVTLLENGQPVRREIVRVNHPLIHEGVRFYQSFFGPAVKVEIKDASGKVLLNDTIPMTRVTGGQVRRNAAFFDLPEVAMTAQLIGPAINAPDTILSEGELAVQVSHAGQAIDMNRAVRGVPQQIGGLEFTYLDDAQYSGFQVSRDPGNSLIWIASSLFVIGVGLVLYFPYKQVWVLVQPRGKNNRILVRSVSPRSFNAASEHQSLLSDIQEQLEPKSR
ncbi:MAG: cytochrome c biogenesis protein ResB [Chloroflexota bacterium]